MFAIGAAVAYLVVAKGLAFLLQFTPAEHTIQLEITGYVDFVTSLMLLFGAAFEFPLIVVMLNLAGLASAKRLLGWWRIAIFLMFVFAAVATPTPDPFGMTFLALALSSLYFAAVGFAFVNDRRRRKASLYPELADDDTSPVEPSPVAGSVSPVSPSDPVEVLTPVAAEPAAVALPLDDRYDDTT